MRAPHHRGHCSSRHQTCRKGVSHCEPPPVTHCCDSSFIMMHLTLQLSSRAGSQLSGCCCCCCCGFSDSDGLCRGPRVSFTNFTTAARICSAKEGHRGCSSCWSGAVTSSGIITRHSLLTSIRLKLSQSTCERSWLWSPISRCICAQSSVEQSGAYGVIYYLVVQCCLVRDLSARVHPRP